MRRSVAAVLLTCAGVVACGDDETPKVEVPLGAVIGLSGTNADASNAESIRLAARHMNEALDDRGYKSLAFRMDIQDSQVSETVSVERSVAAVAAGAKGIISDNTLDAAAVARTYYDDDPSNDLGVPMICGICAGPQVMDVPDPDKWIYRALMSSSPQGGVLLQVMLNRTPPGNIRGDLNGDGVVKLSMVGSVGFGAGTNSAIAGFANSQLDPDPVVETQVRATTIALDSPEWNADMAKLLDANNDTASGATPGVVPDTLFAVMQTLYNVPVVKAYEASGSSIPVLYSSSLRNDQVLVALGGAGEGSEGIASMQYANSDAGRTFAEDFRDAFDTDPNSSNSVYYDAASALMLATLVAVRDLDDASTVSGDAVRDAMLLINDPAGEVVEPGIDGFKRAISAIREGRPINYDGAAGPMDFDAEGNVRSNIARFTLEGGQFVEHEHYDCISDIVNCPVLD